MNTTIKVSDDLRDRLKAQAAHEGLTLGAHLARLADAEDRRRRMAHLAAAVARTPDPARRSSAAESSEWEHTEEVDSAS